MTAVLNSRTAPSGRFIYAAYKTLEKANARFDDMCADGDMTPAEGRIERIVDHNKRLVCYAITIE